MLARNALFARFAASACLLLRLAQGEGSFSHDLLEPRLARLQTLERSLELRGHVIERSRERPELLEATLRHAHVELAGSERTRRARDAAERLGHLGGEQPREGETEEQREREDHGGAAVALPYAREVVGLRHQGGHEPGRTCGPTLVRRDVSEPVLTGERLGRHVREAERKLGRDPLAPQLLGERTARGLDHRVVVLGRRCEQAAETVGDERPAVFRDREARE
jgi:hypothetical protein